MIIARITDVKSVMSRCVLSVCDDTGNGRVVQSTIKGGDDLEIGQYY